MNLSPYHPCPFCWHPDGLLAKVTKRGTYYFRCSACMATGFLNSDLCFGGLNLAAVLVAVFGMDAMRREVAQGGSMLRAFVSDRVPAAVAAARAEKEVSPVASPT